MKKFFGVLVLAGAAAVPAIASAKLVQSGSAETQFNASGPAGMSIVGKTSDFQLDDSTGKTIVFTVPLANLKTGIELRDHHTLAALESDKYPDAKLEVERALIKFPEGGKSSGDVDGTLTLHGKSHAVKVHYEAKSTKSGVSAEGAFKFNTNDYDIKIPTYLGVTVHPDMDATVKFEATDDGKGFAPPPTPTLAMPSATPTPAPTPKATPKKKTTTKKKTK